MADFPIKQRSDRLLAQCPADSLAGQMAKHHPIHGLFGYTFEAVGGVDRMVKFAEEDYLNFIRLFAKMAPTPSGDVTVRQMNIQVNPQLKRTPLDGEIVGD